MSSPVTQQASPAPTTAAQVLDASESPGKTLTAEASNPSAPTAAGSEKVSGKFQALIQREKQALERERVAKDFESKASAREQALAAREAKIQEFESLKETNPLKALELLGLNYQQLTQIALADGQVTPDIQIKKVEDKFDSYLKAQEEEKRKSQEFAQKQQEQLHTQTISKFKTEIGDYLKENSNRYELIGFEQADELVYDVIDEHYNRTLLASQKKAEEEGTDVSECRGEIMTIALAADKIEEHLEKKYSKARDLSKVKALLAPKPMLQNLAKPPTPPRQMPKTLTNNLSATPAAPRKAPISDQERIAKAIAYAKGLRPSL